MRFLLAITLVLGVGSHLQATTLTVDDDGPADYATLRAAVSAAASGDTLLVADGIYRGPENRNIEFGGKVLTIQSISGPEYCIIDCQMQGRAFYFHHSETQNSTLDGLTIMNGRASYGGAVYCTDGASPTIRNCIIRNNHAVLQGGGLSSHSDASPTVEDCFFLSNSSDSSGGGLSIGPGFFTLTRCLVAQNVSKDGGGLYSSMCTAQVLDCTFEGNTARRMGGAVRFNRGTPTVWNSVFRANTADMDGGAVHLQDGDSPAVTNCTFIANGVPSLGAGLTQSGHNSVGLAVTNCAFFDHSGSAIRRSNGPIAIRHCLFHNNQPGDLLESFVHVGADRVNTASESNEHNRSGQPYFSVPGDVRLTLASRHIDRGDNEPAGGLPAMDLDGRPRILDGFNGGKQAVDIGACEYDRAASSIAISASAVEFIHQRGDAAPEPMTLQVGSGGGQPLHWRIDCNSPWLRVEPTSGVCEAPWANGESDPQDHQTKRRPVTLTANPEGLDRGIHQAIVTIHGSEPCGRPRRVLVTLWVRDVLQVPGRYASIQEAVDAALPGETIQVAAGTYVESVSIRKPITLIGVDKPMITDQPVRARLSRSLSSTAIMLETSHCTVDGFHITGWSRGIHVGTADNTIRNNLIANAGTGIYIGNQPSNVLVNNEITNCTDVGLHLGRAINSTFRDNRMVGSPCNLAIDGRNHSDYSNDFDTSNTVDGKPVYYLVEQSDLVIGADSNAGCVIAANCRNLRLSDLDLSHNRYGILFYKTSMSIIERCLIADQSDTGIRLERSPNNTLLDNTVSDCRYGIELEQSLRTTLSGNVMEENTCNFALRPQNTGDYRQVIDSSNTVDGKPIHYLRGEEGITLDGSSNAGCVIAVDCSRLTVRDVWLENNLVGLMFFNTHDSTIENVTCVGNEGAGILLEASPQNTLRDNSVRRNHDGVAVMNSPGTWIDTSTVSFNNWGIRAFTSNLRLTNSRIANNPHMGISCAGLMEADILHCAIHNNADDQYYYWGSAGIHCGSSQTHVSLVNSIVWANPKEQINLGYGGTIEVSHCNIQGGYEGEGNIDAAPLLTPDTHLRAGSPCIGAGLADSNGLPPDLDDELRDPNDRIDIGPDQFVDTDEDGLPDWWEQGYFADPAVARPDQDPDDDAHTNIVEYELYSSDPLTPAAVFYVDAKRPDDCNDGLSWETATRTIQAAIDRASDSDQVRIAPGTYEEDITTGGRQILIQSVDALAPETVAGTIIAGTVTMDGGEMPGCKLTGLTLSNPIGTGLFCSGSSPTIEHCRIVGNRGRNNQGGGITLRNSSPTIAHCTISSNLTSGRGGGLQCRDSQPALDHCLITGNLADHGYGAYGTALFAESSDVRIDHCTIAHNISPYHSPTSGAAVECTRKSQLRVTNSILWNNLPLQVGGSESTVTAVYSDIKGGADAIEGLIYSRGNIVADPCFVSSGHWDTNPTYGHPGRWLPGDYHLQSTGWRWSPHIGHGTHWIWDGRTSRCIDAGHPADGLGRELTTVPADEEHEWGLNVRVNMGAYGGTGEASMAPPGWAHRTDLDNNGRVDLIDFASAGRAFRIRIPRQPGDVTRDGRVDYADLSVMASEWLRTTPWRDAAPGDAR